MTSEARSQNAMKLLLGHLPLESSHLNVTKTQRASWRVGKAVMEERGFVFTGHESQNLFFNFSFSR